MKLVGKAVSLLLAIAMATTMIFIGMAPASAAIVGDPSLSQIGNHSPPIFNTTSMTFTLDATDADFGITEGVFDPVGGFAVSVWGFNELFGGFYLFGDITGPYEEDFSLINGSNVAGQIGIYQLIANVNANNPLDWVDPSKGYYFRIVDQRGEVTFIGAGGQQFLSEADVQSNTILFGSDTIGPSPAEATVDIESNMLNLKSKHGWITAYIELAGDHEVADIDVFTIWLEDLIPAELRPTEIGDYDTDGIPDLMVKFDRQVVLDYLAGMGVNDGDHVELTLTGEVGETPFEGSDTITVISMGKN